MFGSTNKVQDEGGGFAEAGTPSAGVRIKDDLSDRGVPLGVFPESVRALFAEGDMNKDGFLQTSELEEMISEYNFLKHANDTGVVTIAALPQKVQPILRKFDSNGDGTVDPEELAHAARLYEGEPFYPPPPSSLPPTLWTVQ